MSSVPNIRVEEMRKEELPQALDVLAKAFSTQPSSFAIFPGKTDIERRMKTTFRVLLEQMPGQVFVAKSDDSVVGVMRMVQWPDCQMKPLQGIRMLPTLIRAGSLRSMFRALKFRGTWAKSDPKKPHWHLDPLGVAPDLQGQGIGSQMMEFYCSKVDETAMAAYHETDRPENVDFYKKFGFEVVGEESILDFPNWYLLRNPRSGNVENGK